MEPPSRDIYLDGVIPDGIAIVGMSCRLPGGVDGPSSLWSLLEQESSARGGVPPSRFNTKGPSSTPEHGQQSGPIPLEGYFLQQDVRLFDNDFFGISGAEATYMDPQQRQLLEVVYECFENAGMPLDRISGSDTGCYVGSFTNDFPVMQSKGQEQLHRYSATGMSTAILGNRINHAFNMTGPTLVVDTACSSSLYCLHLACSALETKECGAAIVASANLIQSIEQQSAMAKAGVLSPTSTCHTFSSAADGYARAEGVGALYLKRMEDAVRDNDPIRAVIRGTAVGSNGRTNGISAPDSSAQERVIRQAYRKACISPDTTSYVECHGTGTAVGDPVEIEGLTRVFKRSAQHPLQIGSVKSNIGHGEGVSGLSGIIKAVLAIEKRRIPATIGVGTVNPKIIEIGEGIDIVTTIRNWEPSAHSSLPGNEILRAGVNSFGFGGANSHVILEEAPKHANRTTENQLISNSKVKPRTFFLLPFSARNQAALERSLFDMSTSLTTEFRVCDLAYTLGCRRSQFANRGYIVTTNDTLREDLGIKTLRTLPEGTRLSPAFPLVFVFTGQGSQWVGMGKELFEQFPQFRRTIRGMDSILKDIPHAPKWILEDLMFDTSSESPINLATHAQPMTTALQVAMVELLDSWAISPDIVVGHSSGELAAAFASGKISKSQAIIAAYYRGYVSGMLETNGAMLSVGIDARQANYDIQRLGLDGKLCVACHNSSELVTISGDGDAVEFLSDDLQNRGIFARKLKTGGKAYHSHHMISSGPQYENLISPIFEHLPFSDHLNSKAKFISTVTGDEKDSGFGPQYWRTNLELPVLFSKALETILLKERVHLVEVGPHSALELPIKQICTKLGLHRGKIPYSSALKRGENAVSCILDLSGRLYLHGEEVAFGKINWSEEDGPVHVVTDLPPQPWAHDKILWKEPRVSRELREREYPRHELLGSLMPGGDGISLCWKNMLRLDEVKWLASHMFEDTVIFPAAGYMAMAIQAISEVLNVPLANSSSTITFLDVNIMSALVLDDTEVEIFTKLRQKAFTAGSVDSWWEFEISSYQQGLATVHSSGKMHFRSHDDRRTMPDTVDTAQFESFSPQACYHRLAQEGLNFGQDFQSILEIQMKAGRECYHTNTVTGFRGRDGVGSSATYMIHPITIDAMLQSGILGSSAGSLSKLEGMLPVFISSASFHGGTPLAPKELWNIRASSTCMSGRKVESSAILVDNGGHIFAKLEGVKMTGYSAMRPSNLVIRQPISKVVWAPMSEDLRGASIVHSKGARNNEVREVDTKVLIIETEGSNNVGSLLAANLLKHLGVLGSIIKLREITETMMAPGTMVISMLESDTPLLSTITETEMDSLKILTGSASRILWITGGDLLGLPKPDFSLVSGLSRTLMLEHPKLTFSTFDIAGPDAGLSDTAERAIAILLQSPGSRCHFEYIQHKGSLYTSRFALDEGLNKHFRERHGDDHTLTSLQEATPCQLAVAGRGPATKIYFERACILASDSLPSGMVEAEVEAIGLSGKPSLYSGKKSSHRDVIRIHEQIGIVRRVGSSVSNCSVGDKILILAPCPFRTRQIVPERACIKLHLDDDPTILCTQAYEYATVLYALNTRARLMLGERILINHAASLVGLAAVKIAKQLGAEVFVTVADERDTALFISQYHLDITRIFKATDSGYKEMLEKTNGEGFDVILNCQLEDSSHDTINVWLACATFCRFVQLGHGNDTNPERLDLSMFRRNATFSIVDLDDIYHDKKRSSHTSWSKLLLDVISWYRRGHVIAPKQPSLYDVADVSQAISDLVAEKATSAVIFLDNPRSILPVEAPKYTSNFSPDKTYILVGGLGGLGASISKWLLSRGARSFVYIGRSGADSLSARDLVAQLKSSGAGVNVIRSDVSNLRDVENAITSIPGKIGGIVQAAMGLSESLFAETSAKSWHAAIAPKVQGSWNLHQALAGKDQHLDFFLVVSSISGSIGAIAQSNYCAANHYLDVFTRHRRSLGLPAVSVALGMISGAGYLHDNPEVRAKLARTGISSLDEEEMLHIVDIALSLSTVDETNTSRAFSHGHILTGLEHISQRAAKVSGYPGSFPLIRDPRIATMINDTVHDIVDHEPFSKTKAENVSPKELVNELQEDLPQSNASIMSLKKTLSQILIIDPGMLDASRSLASFGADSMVATEIRTWLFEEFDIDLSIFKLLSANTTLESLTEVIDEKLSKIQRVQ